MNWMDPRKCVQELMKDPDLEKTNPMIVSYGLDMGEAVAWQSIMYARRAAVNIMREFVLDKESMPFIAREIKEKIDVEAEINKVDFVYRVLEEDAFLISTYPNFGKLVYDLVKFDIDTFAEVLEDGDMLNEYMEWCKTDKSSSSDSIKTCLMALADIFLDNNWSPKKESITNLSMVRFSHWMYTWRTPPTEIFFLATSTFNRKKIMKIICIPRLVARDPSISKLFFPFIQLVSIYEKERTPYPHLLFDTKENFDTMIKGQLIKDISWQKLSS